MPWRNDLHSAHGEIDRLKREKDELKEKIRLGQKKEKKVKCETCGGWFHRARGVSRAMFFGLLGIGLAACFAWFSYTVATEHGPTYCYIKGDGLVFKLMRNVEWGRDRTVGSYRSMKEALDDAAKLRCELK